MLLALAAGILMSACSGNAATAMPQAGNAASTGTEQRSAPVVTGLPDFTVLVDRFGLRGRPPRTLQEIAHHLGFTRERIRQIEVRALERARRLMDRL